MNDRPKNFDRASGILSQRVGYTWSARKLSRAEGEHFRSGVPPCERDEHTFQGLGSKNARSLFADCGIGICGKNTKGLNAIFGRERSRLAANSKLSFQGRVTGTNFLQQCGANFPLPWLPSKHHASA